MTKISLTPKQINSICKEIRVSHTVEELEDLIKKGLATIEVNNLLNDALTLVLSKRDTIGKVDSLTAMAFTFMHVGYKLGERAKEIEVLEGMAGLEKELD